MADVLLRHIVLACLFFPLSKLKTVDCLCRYQGLDIKIDAVYRFLDRLQSQYQLLIEQLAFKHTKRSQNDNGISTPSGITYSAIRRRDSSQCSRINSPAASVS